MKRFILAAFTLALTAMTAEAGPIRNAVNRIRTSIKSVRAPKSCTPAVATVGMFPKSVSGTSAAPICNSGACQVVPSK